MSHITKINGTNHEINSGKVLRSGTTYNISSGKTLISGTEKNISFSNTISVIVTGSGNTAGSEPGQREGYCYFTINDGSEIGTAGTYEANIGDVLNFCVYGYDSTYYGEIRLNNSSKKKVTTNTTGTYSYTIPAGVKFIYVEMSYESKFSQRHGRINISTSAEEYIQINTSVILRDGSGYSSSYVCEGSSSGTKHDTASTFYVASGSTLYCCCQANNSSYTAKIYVNDVLVAQNPSGSWAATYNYIVSKKCNIEFNRYTGDGLIYITEL